MGCYLTLLYHLGWLKCFTLLHRVEGWSKNTILALYNMSMAPNEQHIPSFTSSSSNDDHSCRKRLAPVRLPSPPMHTRLVMLFCTRLRAALSRPSRVLKSLQRALPITVPPYITQSYSFTFSSSQDCYPMKMMVGWSSIISNIRHPLLTKQNARRLNIHTAIQWPLLCN